MAWKPSFLKTKFCFIGMEARFLIFWHESQVLFYWRGSQTFGFWRESRVFWFSKVQVSTKSRLPANGIASIDGMSLPCSFSCENRWNVVSSRVLVQVSTECRFPAFFKKFVLWVLMECLSDVNFDSPSPRETWFGEISIHLYMLFKFYIENEDSDYPQNRRITIASYGTAVTPFFDES